MSWKFHYEMWGDLLVSVMPYSNALTVVDSNVGIVLTCTHMGDVIGGNKYQHPENAVLDAQDRLTCKICGAIPASVVVRTKGEKPMCDLLALSRVIGYSNAEKILSDGSEPIDLNLN